MLTFIRGPTKIRPSLYTILFERILSETVSGIGKLVIKLRITSLLTKVSFLVPSLNTFGTATSFTIITLKFRSFVVVEEQF